MCTANKKKVFCNLAYPDYFLVKMVKNVSRNFSFTKFLKFFFLIMKVYFFNLFFNFKFPSKSYFPLYNQNSLKTIFQRKFIFLRFIQKYKTLCAKSFLNETLISCLLHILVVNQYCLNIYETNSKYLERNPNVCLY